MLINKTSKRENYKQINKNKKQRTAIKIEQINGNNKQNKQLIIKQLINK